MDHVEFGFLVAGATSLNYVGLWLGLLKFKISFIGVLSVNAHINLKTYPMIELVKVLATFFQRCYSVGGFCIRVIKKLPLSGKLEIKCSVMI